MCANVSDFAGFVLADQPKVEPAQDAWIQSFQCEGLRHEITAHIPQADRGWSKSRLLSNAASFRGARPCASRRAFRYCCQDKSTCLGSTTFLPPADCNNAIPSRFWAVISRIFKSASSEDVRPPQNARLIARCALQSASSDDNSLPKSMRVTFLDIGLAVSPTASFFVL